MQQLLTNDLPSLWSIQEMQAASLAGLDKTAQDTRRIASRSTYLSTGKKNEELELSDAEGCRGYGRGFETFHALSGCMISFHQPSSLMKTIVIHLSLRSLLLTTPLSLGHTFFASLSLISHTHL